MNGSRVLASVLTYLLESNEISNPVARAIAKRIIDQGLGALIGRQQDVYYNILRSLIDLPCGRCGVPLELGEVTEAYMKQDGLCRRCREGPPNMDL